MINRRGFRIAASFTPLLGLVAATASAQTFSVLHAFTTADVPAQGLVRDKQGNLYGTTGGVVLRPPQPPVAGTVFKIDTNGQFTTLLTFNGSNGARPSGGHLLRDDKGNLYGLTSDGGVLPDGSAGAGIVYKLDASGHQTILHVFGGAGDGAYPTGTLFRDRMGNFYGATIGGGANGFGSVFMLTPGGGEMVLHSFNIGTDGWFPGGGLVADQAGNLYGVTRYGGVAPGVALGIGEVYEITSSGTYTVLHVFPDAAPDGTQPFGELTVDGAGYLYGVTGTGGTRNFGTVFKIDQTGKETVLHSFRGSSHGDGAFPAGGLVRDATGNFYGATSVGGSDPSSAGSGTVFQMHPSGKVILLFSFPASGSDGSPNSRLIRDENGNLYGTVNGSSVTEPSMFGAVFKLTP